MKMKKIPLIIYLLLGVSNTLIAGDTYSNAEALYKSERYYKAAELFGNACESGNAKACNRLGEMHVSLKPNLGVEYNPSKAFELYTKACDMGSKEGCHKLGIINLAQNTSFQANGIDVFTDSDKGLEILSSVCKKGYVDSCMYLADYYDNKQKYTESASYLSEACDNGSDVGCNRLGVIYQQGKYLTQSYPAAVELYNKTCQHNYGWGCFNLAQLYYEGRGVDVDDSKASSLFAKGCKAGHSDSCATLGWTYESGKLGKKDLAKAKEWYEKACKLNNFVGCAKSRNLFKQKIGKY